MYKSGHTKSKSDTDFYSNKMVADEITGILSSFNDTQPKTINFKKIKKQKSLQKKITNSWQRRKSSFMYIFLHILLFKKYLDYYFFEKKIPLIKLDLDNVLIIINKKIEELKSKLIDECPILSKSVLIEKLNEFNEIILSLIETKPQEFYKQVKIVILSHFEQIRLEIFELIENLCDKTNNINSMNTKDINQIKKDVTFNHGILFNFLVSMNGADNYYENDLDVHLTSEVRENIISVILPRKKLILQFIEDITHELLFSMTKFSYVMDYYTLSISELNQRLLEIIDLHLKQKDTFLDEKEKIILFLIELIFELSVGFNRKPSFEFQNMHITLGNFLLNNLMELIPKTQIFNFSYHNDFKKFFINENKLYSEKLLIRSLFIKSQQSNLFYNYSTRFSQKKNKYKLNKTFQLYYEIKYFFWKSIYTKTETDKKESNICCRICEQNIPLNDFVLHVFYCKEQNNYYKTITKYKAKMKENIKSLEIFRTRINHKINDDHNNFYKKNFELNKIIKQIKKGNKLGNLDDKNSDDFLYIFIKIYMNENQKSNDYYEIHPDKISNLVLLIYLAYFIFVLNKKKLNDNNFEDIELSNIIGNIIGYMIKIWKITTYILEASYCRTKSNKFLNNSKNNFQNSDLGNFQDNIDSSKDLSFIEINKRNNFNEFTKRRCTVRETKFSLKMVMFKNQFSFNKKHENQNGNNMGNNYSFMNGDSSHSNIDKSKEITIADLRAKSTKVDEGSLDFNRLSGNFKLLMNSRKKEKKKSKNGYKNKIIRYIRNEFKEFKKNKEDKIKNHKSGKFKLNKQSTEKNSAEDNLFFFNKKESTIIGDDNNSLSFLSFDKKSNIDSQSLSKSFSGSEKEINKNDYILNNKGNFFLSSKNNNEPLKFNNSGSGDISLKLKSDSPIFKYNINTSKKRKSLFKVYNDDEEKQDFFTFIRQKKKIKDSENKNKRRNTLENYHSEKNQINKLEYFGKLISCKKRKSSPDISMDKMKLSEYGKNLVLIDNIGSENSSSESRKSNISNNSNKNNTKTKIFKIKSSSSITSESLENIKEESKKDDDKEDSIDRSSSIKDYEYRNIFNDKEKEKELFHFDTNFFINTVINANNPNLVNTLKNWLIEINDEIKPKDEQENDKSVDSSILKAKDTGTKFSNFKLVLPIAKGGFGTVGLYKKISTGDLYTIKSVNINKMKEKKLSKTLQNERNIMKEISSDYVVTTYYLFKDKTNYYFVMEYLPGGDVYNLLSSIILPFSTIQLIVAETLLAVNYLHSKNILHHDIKPENILITKNGHFKLSDFGLSKTLNKKGIKKANEDHLNFIRSSDCSSNSSLIDSEHDDNKIEGTLYYMSPELFTGDYPVGKPIDYWAIGIIIFELFTFKVPFEAANQEEAKQNIINYNINWDPIYSDDVEKHYKDYIDPAVDLIKKFIFFNPSQRWGDNDFDKIKNHEFFKGFDWANIKSIKSPAVLSYLKKIVEKNNNKIKEFNKGNKIENIANIICEENLVYDEEDNKFSQRIDNLQKRNNELIKMKFKKKEIKIEENDNNFKRSLFFDLQ